MKISDVHIKAKRIYHSKEFLRSCMENRSLFPLIIPLSKTHNNQLNHNFSEYREQCEKFFKECHKLGIELRFKTINNRVLGIQSIPQDVCFPSEDVFLKFLAKKDEFEILKKNSSLLSNEFPQLKEFILKSPDKILVHEKAWPNLITVCHFLMANPSLNLYIRQLEIPGIDTKFIEKHKRILSELLTILTENSPSKKSTIDLFEEKYGLKKEEARLRFRLLDPTLRPLFLGLEDLETPVADLAKIEIPCDTVLIIENKVTGLCIPPRAGTVVFFELGYKAALLKKIPWMEKKRILYWGDIDTHGFAILSQLRSHYPQIESRLMNKKILLSYQPLWSIEESPFLGDCPHLNPEEQELFQELKSDHLGTKVRLEQERISLTDFNY